MFMETWQKKIEAPQGVSEAIRKNKGHDPKHVLSTTQWSLMTKEALEK